MNRNIIVILGTIFAMSPFWVSAICTILQCVFGVGEVYVMYVLVTLAIVSLVGLGICIYKIDDYKINSLRQGIENEQE
jgi:hypothetical protein